MWAGFLTLAGGWVLPVLALVAGPICDASLAGLVDVVNWAEAVPGGYFWAPGPAWWWVIGFYLGLAAVMLRGRTLVAPRWQVALVCLWILVGLAPSLARAWTRGDELRCSFVAVGHGTCVVLQTPDGQTLLYDAGMLGPPEYATQTVAGYLWDRGLWRIDAILLSHADVDHYNAVPGLVERFRVGTVYVSPLMFDEFGATGPTRGPEMLRLAIAQASVPIREIWSGDRLRVGADVTIDVIHPPRLGVVGRDNANSITVVVEHAGRRLLLPGDLETPGLEDVMAELPVDCDVLMAPHHGSRRSDPPGFAAWSTPEWVVISGGADADPEVRRSYELAGAQVLNTGEVGAVEFAMRRQRIDAAAWRPVVGR
jgi:competence protein ComEC